MSYTINFSDPTSTSTIIVPDMPPGINTVDTSLNLIGKGYPNYGQKTAENFLHLLENFANALPPPNAITGQLWYDTSDPNNKILKVRQSTDIDNWSNVSGIYQQAIDPSTDPFASLKIGDIWIDTSRNQLKIYTGATWILIGPQTANLGSGNTPTASTNGPYPSNLNDNIGGNHDVIINFVDGNPVAIISASSFTPNPTILGFGNIKAGINLVSGSVYNGIATAAQNLYVNNAVVTATNFLRADSTNVTSQQFFIQNDAGLFLGSDLSFGITKKSGSTLLTNTTPGGTIQIQATTPTPSASTSTIITIDYKSVVINSGTVLTVSGESLLQGVTASLITATTATITSNISIGGTVNATTATVSSNVTLGGNVLPTANFVSDLGSQTNGFNHLYARYIGTQTSNIYGTVYGNLEGQLIGPITANSVSAVSVSNTVTSYMTVAALDTSINVLSQVPYALVVPGMMMVWANTTPPPGWLVCNGTHADQATYPALYNALIGSGYQRSTYVQLPNPTSIDGNSIWIIKY
jgi:Phage Tail Collar Domain